MPFPQQTPKAFTRANVEALNPNQHGVYGIYRANDAWVYVGKGDIRQRLLDHLNGDNPCITREKPTHWVDEVTSNADAREKQLIVELNPICNKKVG
jgi:excinuclease UvrABC nuclease subunit